MTERGQIRRWGSLIAVIVLLLTACGGASAPTDPTDALVDAVERSLSGAFAFEIQVEMDEAARAELPSGDVRFGALLDSLEITGHTSGDDTLALTVAAMGQQLFELRQTDATHTYMRTNAGRIAEAFGTSLDREELLADVGEAPDAVGELWTGLLDGRWVGIVGEPSQEPDSAAMMLMGGVDPSEMAAAQRQAIGDSPAEFARRFTSASFAGSDGGDGPVLDVRVHTRAMAEAMQEVMFEMLGDEAAGDPEPAGTGLERIPETVGGITVEVSDRLVDRLTVDVFEVLRSLSESGGDAPDGSIRLVADISEHGTTGPVAAPDDVLEVAAEDLGHHHPGSFLPLGGLGSGMLWPLMGLMPMGMSTSVETVESLESSVELEAATPVPASPPEVSAEGPSPYPPQTVEGHPPMSMDISPHAGPAGSQVTITVEGFADGPVEVRWDDRDGPVLATAEGPDFTVDVTVPADAARGQHSFVLEARSPGANQGGGISFEVTD